MVPDVSADVKKIISFSDRFGSCNFSVSSVFAFFLKNFKAFRKVECRVVSAK